MDVVRIEFGASFVAACVRHVMAAMRCRFVNASLQVEMGMNRNHLCVNESGQYMSYTHYIYGIYGISGLHIMAMLWFQEIIQPFDLLKFIPNSISECLFPGSTSDIWIVGFVCSELHVRRQNIWFHRRGVNSGMSR